MSSETHFGCCLSCRAPLMPPYELFWREESQSVLYLVNRFQQLSLGSGNSAFTGNREESHLLPQQHYKPAYVFCAKLEKANIAGPIAGWDSDLSQTTFNATDCFKLPTSSVTYFAAWDSPKITVKHTRLRRFLAETKVKRIDIEDDLKTISCSLCNDIWDCWARVTQILSSGQIVPYDAVHCMTQKGGARVTIPQKSDAQKAKSTNYDRRGCLAAYYLHASLAHLADPVAPQIPTQAFDDTRAVSSLLMWIPLHLTAMYQELVQPLKKEKTSKQSRTDKGPHNYLGIINLMTAYYLWILGRTDADAGLNVPFDRFAVCYVKEICEAPPPVWDSSEHARLCDFVFDTACPPYTDLPGRVSYVSDRLVELYTSKIRHVVPLMRGDAADPAAPREFRDAAEAYFVTGPEVRQLLRDIDAKHSETDIAYFLEKLGTAAVLWQIRRNLAQEPEVLRRELDNWISARLNREYDNIAKNSDVEMSARDARMVYNVQNSIAPGNIMPADDVGAIQTGDWDALVESVEKLGRCSVFKAAVRLQRWRFTQKPQENLGTEFVQSFVKLQIGKDFKPRQRSSGRSGPA